MVRVSGSFNSNLAELNEKDEIINIPESAEVKIKQKWNAVRPSINYYLNSIFISQIQNSRKFIEIESDENILFTTRTATRSDILKRCYKFQYPTTESTHYGVL